MNEIRNAINLLGGEVMIAREIGIGRSAVRAWAFNRAIPQKHHSKIKRIALQKGVNIDIAEIEEKSVEDP